MVATTAHSAALPYSLREELASSLIHGLGIVLSIAGLSWRETEALLAAHPDIVADAARGTR